MLKLAVSDIHKSYGSVEVLKGVSLHAGAGDVVSIIGASGSGKSTFLRCINFLERPSAGHDGALDGEVLATIRDRDGMLRASDRAQLQRMRSRLAMVFQNFCLWSHLSVLANVIEAPISVLGVPKAEAVDRAKAISRVGLGFDVLDKYPAHLSGGQQQRVAIARALSVNRTPCCSTSRPPRSTRNSSARS